MSDEKQGTGVRDQRSGNDEQGQRDKETKRQREPGPNLWLLYGLIALGLLLAAGCAALIVFPFYSRR
jgi:hypothetical protein